MDNDSKLLAENYKKVLKEDSSSFGHQIHQYLGQIRSDATQLLEKLPNIRNHAQLEKLLGHIREGGFHIHIATEVLRRFEAGGTEQLRPQRDEPHDVDDL